MDNKANTMLKLAIISTILVPGFWLLWVFCEDFFYNPSPNYNIRDIIHSVSEIGFVVAMISAIGAWTTLVFYRIRQKQGKEKPSGFLCFAVADVVLMLGTAAYAAFDMLTNSDELFGGLIGLLLLIFIIPIMLFVLLIDCIIAYIYKRKEKTKEKTDKKTT